MTLRQTVLSITALALVACGEPINPLITDMKETTDAELNSVDLAKSTPDLARTTDLTPLPDLGALPDLTTVVDLAELPNLAKSSPDLAETDGGFSVLQGRVEVTENFLGQPKSSILVADGRLPYTIATFLIFCINEGCTVSRIRVPVVGDGASYQKISIYEKGVELGWAIVPPRVNESVDVEFQKPLLIAANSGLVVSVCATLAPVTARSVQNFAQTGAPYSGLTVKAGIEVGYVGGNWGPEYAGKFNIRARGDSTGNDLFGDGQTSMGNTFVVRKAKPVFNKRPLQDHTLTPGWIPLLSFHESFFVGDPMGGGAQKQYLFYFETASKAQIVDSLTVRLGNQVVPTTITVLPGMNGGWYAQIIFDGEAWINGPGVDVTILGLVQNFAPREALFIRSVKTGNKTVTGYLTDKNVMVNGFPGPHLDTGWMPGGQVTQLGMAWSDASELPHSDRPNDSRDWTDDYLAEGWDSLSETLVAQ